MTRITVDYPSPGLLAGQFPERLRGKDGDPLKLSWSGWAMKRVILRFSFLLLF